MGKDSSGDNEFLDFEGLKESMDKWGIDKSVVFPFNGDDSKLIADSLEILEKSKKEDWIIPFLRFNPNYIGKEEFEGLLDKGFRGVKLHARAQNFVIDSEKYFWIYEVCSERGLPVLFHCSVIDDASSPSRILNVCKRFPDLKVVMAHFFGNDFSIMKVAKNYPNLYVDTSMNSGTMKRNQTVKKYGFDRLVFASDVPYDSQGVSLLKIREAGLNDEEERIILEGNAERLLNICYFL